MPSFDEYLDFNPSAYRAKLRTLSWQDLQAREQAKRRNKIGASTRLGASIGAMPITFGASAFGAALSGRALWIEDQKLLLLQEELHYRNVQARAHTSADFYVPFVANMGATFVGGAIGVGVSEAIGPAIAPTTHAVVGAAASHPVVYDAASATQGFGHGVSHAVSGITSAATGHASSELQQGYFQPYAFNPVAQGGYSVGQSVVTEGLKQGGTQLAQSGITHMVDNKGRKAVNPYTAGNKPVHRPPLHHRQKESR